MLKNLPTFLIFTLLISSCVKDQPPHTSKTFTIPPLQQAALIVNEGSLGLGNASLSILDQEQWIMYQDVFNMVNSRPMGDIFQSIYTMNNELFLLMNNSDEILVVDDQNFALKNKIKIKKPRYMLQIDATHAYVTSLFNRQIYVLNTTDLSITDSISLPFEHSEQLVENDGYVYVCNWNIESNFIYKIDPQTHEIVQSIDIGVKAAHGIVVDKNNHLWIFSGQPREQIPAAITVYDPQTERILRQKIFDGISEYLKPALSPHADTIYYLGVNYDGGLEGNGVFFSSILDEELHTHTFLAAAPYQYFWGLAVDRDKRHLYLADPRGFIQRGKLSVYDLNGPQVYEHFTGIGPGNIYFLNKP